MQQGVERGVGLAFMDHWLADTKVAFASLERLHEFELLADGLVKQLQLPQLAVAAGRFHPAGMR